MAKKIIGYTELVWTCPNCGTKNPGSARICKNCGSAMAEDVKFEQNVNAEMIKDEKIIEQAKRGPDIYCAYCGNRNPAGAVKCSRCGADLSEGKEREHGQQYRANPSATSATTEASKPSVIICPTCGTENPAGSQKCRGCGASLIQTEKLVERDASEFKLPETNAQAGQGKKGCGRGCLVVVIILALFLILGVVFGTMFMADTGSVGNGNNAGQVFDFDNNNSDNSGGYSQPAPRQNERVNARVSATNWQTAVEVIGDVDSRGSGWRDNLPSDARNLDCRERLYKTYDEEVPGSREKCDEPYQVDYGNGYAAWEQECVYEVYKDYCDYTTSKRGVIDTARASGSDSNPQLPYVSSQYQTGNQSASYQITLTDENGRRYTLTPRSVNEYRSYSVGDQYILELNGRGQIVNMEKK